MAHLELFCLGAPRVVLDGAPVTFDTRKAVALLAYLAVTGQPQQRDALAALLWPDADSAHARGALRRTLSVLHAALGRTPLLRIERDQVELRLDGGVTCDVQDFRTLGAFASGRAGPPCAYLAQLEAAAARYGDHFMAGFSLRDSAAYDDWQFFEGEELRRLLAHVLETLTTCHTARRDWAQAITHARRRLALDTLHEPAHRQLMLLYAWSDQRAAALRQYGECQRILDAELGVPPLAETTALYTAILNHQPPAPPPLQAEQATAAAAALPTPPAPTSPSAPEPPPRAPAALLAGRKGQWEALLGAYGRITTHGHLVVIEGEAGAGKTALAQAFLAHVRSLGATTAAGVCYAGEETLAYAPVEQLLRAALADPQIAARLHEIDSPWRPALEGLLPDLPAARSAAAASGEAAAALGSQAHFLEGLTRSLGILLNGARPGALLLDDLQHADNATLDLLAYMVRRLHTVPLLVIATWCTGDVPPHDRLRQMAAEAARRGEVTHLTLPPLDAAAILELLEAGTDGLASAADRPALARRLLAETRGLPLFVAEYLNLLRTRPLDVAAAAWPAPQGVRQFLHTRLGGLGETAQQLAATAAVIGRSFDIETVIEASGRSEEEGIAALEELLARGLILEGGGDTLDFAHAQLRSLIYDATSQVRRRLLHRRVAAALAAAARRSGSGQAGAAAALAYHFERGGEPAEAARWAAAAGDHARAVYANREAIAHYEKALALGAPDPYPLHLHLGDLHTLQGEYSQAQASYRAAADLCPADPSATGDVEHRLGRLHHRLGDPAAAARHFARAFELLAPVADQAHAEHGGGSRRAAVLADWSLAAYALHDLDEAVRLAQAALAQAGQAEPGEPNSPVDMSGGSTAARAYDILSLVARRRDDLDAAAAMAERSLAAARTLHDPSAEMAALNSLALAHAARGAVDQAIPLLKAALDRALRLGDRHREAALRNNLADLYHACGEPAAAMQELKQAVAIFAEVGAEAGHANAEIWMLSEW